jgi:hypothetical protein
VKQQFRAVNFQADKLAIIGKADAIIAEYGGQRLSARQVYYRFIGDDLLPASWVDAAYNAKNGLPPDTKNTPKNYQRLIATLVDARYAGLVSWDAIEDRGREPSVPSEWDSVDDIVDAAVNQFRLPRWRNQPKHVELWVEKDALSGVLAPIARRWHVPLVVNKGYSSASAMKAAADRMLEALGVTVQVQCDGCADDFGERYADGACKGCGKKTSAMFRYNDPSGDEHDGDFRKDVHVLYLGDHDPSGEDMVRDIRDRLTEFGVPRLKVDKIALTMPQIRKFKPPPNPAKITDSRAKAYIEKFGDQSWEVDALPPRELNQLVEQAIARNVNKDLMDAIVALEDRDRERVRAAIAKSRE